MQQIDSALLPLYMESNLQTWELLNPTSSTIDWFAWEPFDEANLIKQMELYWMCDINLSWMYDINQFGFNQMGWPYIQQDQLNMNFSNFKSSKIVINLQV